MEKLGMGLLDSPYDPRDFTVEDIVYGSPELPREYEGLEPTIRNQGMSGMCVAFSLASMKEIHELKERRERILFSPAFIYGIRENGIMSEGMALTVALGQLRKYGVCEARDFYEIGTAQTVHNMLVPKMPVLMPRAVPNAIGAWLRLSTENDIKRAIVQDGSVLIGARISENFYRVNTSGVVEHPRPTDKSLGGHAMLVTGWRIIDEKLHWKLANSWGDRKGDRGFYYLPADYPDRLDFFGATDLPLRLNWDTTIEMQVGSNEAVITKKGATFRTTMDVPPQVVDGRSLVPLRFISENLDYDVQYVPSNRKIFIKSR